MEKKEKYYLYVEGQEVEVSREVYTEYYHYKNKEEYFMKKLKEGRTKTDPVTKEKIYLPSREDSYDRIADTYGFLYDRKSESIEDIIIKKEDIDSLYRAINLLEDVEKEIIKELFFFDKSETGLAREKGVSITTIRYHKAKALKKLKILL